MALIEWKDEYSVKVQLFDEHHQQLITIINQLHEAKEQRRTPRELDVIFSKLIEYTQIHFDSEETLLHQYHYPGLHDQQGEHANFVESLRNLRKSFKEGNENIDHKVLEFLQSWLLCHILDSDMAYSAYLNEKGVS